jgi:predicted dehydrogenase
MQHRTSSLSRRRFLRHTAATLTTLTLVPRHAVAGSPEAPPSAKLNLAFIGAGGRAGANLKSASGQNVVALCDVDSRRAQEAFKNHPDARTFQDFRRMFDAMEKEIDAVVVSTPDHTHAVAAMAAMKRGKHVYCEKPLAHSVGEVRALQKAAREHKVITQLGNQGHSSGTIRDFVEWIRAGAIGNVHTVHAVAEHVNSRIGQLPRLQEEHEVPPHLDWDLWLGPAQFRRYNPVYLPGSWRAWSPFGNGTLGDWVCHVVDPSFWALDLGAPATIQAEAKNYDPQKHADTFPAGSIVTFEFPAKGKRGPVKLVWFDGSEKPPRPADMEADDKPPRTGAIVMGDKGTIVHGSHGAGQVRLIPDAKMQAFERPPKTLPRVKDHMGDWFAAIKANKPAGSNFDYGGALTELALLGLIAIKLLGQKLEWNGERFTNSTEANQYLNPPCRQGWAIY